MPTQSVFALVNAVADEAMRAGTASSDGALRAQAAFVRTLVDEVERRHPSEYWIAPLHEQLGEELVRLERLAAAGGNKITGARGAARVTEALSPADVLVVDDDAGALTAIEAALCDWGYPCRTALDAESALHAYAERPAAIVLSDWSMPGMSGLELCKVLKHKEPPPYVILVTAFHDHAQLLEAARGNADDFLAKPVDLGELERRLSAAAGLIRAVRSVANLTERLRSAPPSGLSSRPADSG